MHTPEWVPIISVLKNLKGLRFCCTCKRSGRTYIERPSCSIIGLEGCGSNQGPILTVIKNVIFFPLRDRYKSFLHGLLLTLYHFTPNVTVWRETVVNNFTFKLKKLIACKDKSHKSQLRDKTWMLKTTLLKCYSCPGRKNHYYHGGLSSHKHIWIAGNRHQAICYMQ